MSKSISEVIEQIKKLQALSTSSNANEAAAAAAAANRLIDKYRVSQYDLESSIQFEEPIIQDSDPLYQTGRITAWKSHLVYVLTKHYGVAYYNDVSFPKDRKVSNYRMVGKASDIQIVRYMFSWLSMECDRLAAKEAKGSDMGRVYVASYQEGFVAGVAKQLEISRQEIKKEASAAAMIKIDARYQLSKDEMYKLVPSLKSVKSSSARQINGSAFAKGMEKGKSIHLGATLDSNGAGIKMMKT